VGTAKDHSGGGARITGVGAPHMGGGKKKRPHPVNAGDNIPRGGKRAKKTTPRRKPPPPRENPSGEQLTTGERTPSKRVPTNPKTAL